MKLPLEIRHDPKLAETSWKSSLPFVDNSRAKFIHRPRTVGVFKCGKRPAHLGIHMWCGSSQVGGKKFTFIETIPEDGKLLCARCEAAAIENGLPSAKELSGHHVKLGRLIPIEIKT